MKLFKDTPSKQTTPLSNYSMEECRDFFDKSDVISTESMATFMARIKDSFVTAYDTVTMKYNDKAVLEVMSNKFLVLEKGKVLDFTITSENLTSIPESFNGKYVDYLKDLKSVVEVSLPGLDILLDDLKMAIASLINDADNDKLSTIYKYDSFKKAEKVLEGNVKLISRYFPYNSGKSKGKFRDVLHTYQDLSLIFGQVEDLDKAMSRGDLVEHIMANTRSCKDMIDTLVSSIVDGSVKLENEKLKKELTVITYIASKYIEHVAYLLVNVLVFYGVFKNNCEDLIKM